MKEQQFDTIDSFNPDEWNPVSEKVFQFQVNTELYGWFTFDKERGIWRGRMFEEKTYEISSPLEIKEFNFIWSDIANRLENWGLCPDQVTWNWRGHKFDVCDYQRAIRNIIHPEPFMIYKTCERVDGCEIKTSYYIERTERAVWLEIQKTIRNDDVDLNKLWNVYVDQMKKRIREPFKAMLTTERS